MQSHTVRDISNLANVHVANIKRTASFKDVPSNPNSPRIDRKHAGNLLQCPGLVQDIMANLRARERAMNRNANYLAEQPEINEKMRTILVDWIVDVHLKFKLHTETFYLAVDIVDRYLSVAKGTRVSLQLIGVTAVLLAAKYEEIWPPEIRECVHISAKTYRADEIIKMERAITAALQFKLTVPTPFQFATRLMDVADASTAQRNLTMYLLEMAVMDYNHLKFLPSQVASAAFYCASSVLGLEPWNSTMGYYSGHNLPEILPCAQQMLSYTNAVRLAGKYQAIQRKYSAIKYGEAAKTRLPETL